MKQIENQIKILLNDHQSIAKKMHLLIDDIAEIATVIAKCLDNGGKILLMGNGGSAADSQHLAAEFVGRFQAERKGLSAIALTTDTSVLTSVSNDYGFEAIFERQIEALCKPEDAVIGISTSGNSSNVISALDEANRMGAVTIGFSGQKKAAIDQVVTYGLKIPAVNTARIQEMHILCGHIMCEIVENSI